MGWPGGRVGAGWGGGYHALRRRSVEQDRGSGELWEFAEVVRMRAKRQHDGDQADSSERNWNGTFNEANECTARGGNSPAYDGPGNMTDDGVNYTYVYDVFGRLKTVKTRGGSPATVSEYTYNGLGHRIGWHYDADTDADVDGSDPWYWFFYDERWRMVATYRGSDSNPKERFVYHNAGANGYGGSSYIDSVILRDSDESVGWTTAAPDSTLENRYYYLQNWRADVVALIQADGVPLEYVRYSAYGVPYVYSSVDVNRDGVVDMDDVYAWDDYHDFTTGDAAVDIDINRDGSVTGDDATLVWDIQAWGAWSSSGRGVLSRLGSRKGYAGYEFDPATSQWHVRHRVLVSEMGRWSRRDPAGYVEGINLLEYVGGASVKRMDPSGLGPVEDCQAAVLACESDPRIVAIKQYLASRGMSYVPPPLCLPSTPPYDNECSRGSDCGGFSPRQQRIVICAGRTGCGDVCSSYYHELIHLQQALDHGLYDHNVTVRNQGYQWWVSRAGCIANEYEAYYIADGMNDPGLICSRVCGSCAKAYPPTAEGYNECIDDCLDYAVSNSKKFPRRDAPVHKTREILPN